MPAAFDPSVPTTELDAVNSMLAAIGEQKLPTGTVLTTTGRADIDLAVDTLAKATREMLSAGWKFNSLYGVKVAPTSFLFGGTNYNVFKVPTGVLKWTLTPCAENKHLDLIERPSVTFAPVGTLVLYDRARNAELFLQSSFPYVYLDVIEARSFELMPETARRYASIKAARIFSGQTVGSQELAGLTQQVEMEALRELRRDQGVTERLNFLDSIEGYNWAGGRVITGDGRFRRVYPGGVT